MNRRQLISGLLAAPAAATAILKSQGEKSLTFYASRLWYMEAWCVQVVEDGQVIDTFEVTGLMVFSYRDSKWPAMEVIRDVVSKRHGVSRDRVTALPPR